MNSFSRELAGIAVAAGLAVSASGAFAQEANDTAAPATEIPAASETVTSIENYDFYNGQFPIGYFYGLVALALLGSAYPIIRRTDGSVLRTFALAAGLAGIANPQETVNDYRDLPTVVPVFVDHSLSVGPRAA